MRQSDPQADVIGNQRELKIAPFRFECGHKRQTSLQERILDHLMDAATMRVE